MKKRCTWAKSDLMIKYHDKEWGKPVHNDRKIFEALLLDSAQAGLSWEIILKKRENYRKAFDNFDYEKISKHSKKDIENHLKNEGIVRNKLKINSAIQNAKVFIKIRKEFGSFNKYLWSFVNNKPIINKFKKITDLPTKTKLSEKISKDLKKRGMNFVGPTIIYAFMQGIGVVNDHEINCFRYKELTK